MGIYGQESFGELKCFDAVRWSAGTFYVSGCPQSWLALPFGYAVKAKPEEVPTCALIAMYTLLNHCSIRIYLICSLPLLSYMCTV